MQTGTSHGGVPLARRRRGRGQARLQRPARSRRGRPRRVRHRRRGAARRQHAAGRPLFHLFPTVEAAEIHLATGFQNAVYDHPAFPAGLRAEIEAWLFENAADERKPGQTDSQFIYTSRKKAIGPFKRQTWSLATKGEILASQAVKLAFLFDQLKVSGSADLLARYVPNGPEGHRPAPAALLAAVAS